MGILETLLLLGGLGGVMYFGVYYLIPAMQQMAYAPLYYAQAQAQQQQQPQQPAPAPAPAPLPETPAPAPLPETPVAETPAAESTDDEKIGDTIDKALEDAGLKKDPPKEEPDKKKSSTKKKTTIKPETGESEIEMKGDSKKKVPYPGSIGNKNVPESGIVMKPTFVVQSNRINKRRYVYYNEDGYGGYYYI